MTNIFRSVICNDINTALLYKRGNVTNAQSTVVNLNDDISNFDYLAFKFREAYNNGSYYEVICNTDYLSMTTVKASAGYIGSNSVTIIKNSENKITINASPTGSTWAGQIIEVYGIKGKIIGGGGIDLFLKLFSHFFQKKGVIVNG